MTSGSEESTDEIRSRLERLSDRLQQLRRRIDDPAASATQREADFYAYDEALVSAADILEVDVPAAARDELSPSQRHDIEAGLSAAGVDVSSGNEPDG